MFETLRQLGRSIIGLSSRFVLPHARLNSNDRQWYQSLGASTVVHVCIIGIASCWWTVLRQDAGANAVDTRWANPEESTIDRTLVEEVGTVIAPAKQQPGGRPQVTFSFQTAAISPADLSSLSKAVAPIVHGEAYTTSDLSERVAISQAAARTHSQGTGSDSGDGEGFFGLKAAGKRIVYVVDCSRSMNHPHPSEFKTRFRRVKVELVRSINGMGSDMQFFIIFFNERAIAMPARSLQPALPLTQKKYLYWMQSIRADGDTNPIDALRLALSLRPEVIYFLTDGSFKRNVAVELLNLDQDRTTIHTFAFQQARTPDMQQAIQLLKAKEIRKAAGLLTDRELRAARAILRAEITLKGIAVRNGGEYHLLP